MKRFVALLLTLVFSLSFLTFSAFADETKPMAVDLCQQWDTYGRPADVIDIDYVDFSKEMPYSDNQSDIVDIAKRYSIVTISFKNLTEERKAEIRSMVSNPDCIRFVEVKYSYDELYAVYKKLWAELMPTGNVMSIRLSELLNRIYVDTCGIGSDEAYAQFVEECKARYGDIVEVVSGKISSDITSSTTPTTSGSKPTAEQLKNQWIEKGYPDDVGGISSGIQKQVDIFLVNATEKRKAEIAAMVSDPENLVFQDVKYSYNDMLAVIKDICKNFDFDSELFINMIEIWICESGNYVTVSIHPEVEADVYNQYAEKLKALYGDKVTVNDGTRGIVVNEGTKGQTYEGDGDLAIQNNIITGAPKNSTNIWILPVLILIVALASFGVFFFLRSRRVRAMQLAGGPVVIGDHKLSRIEVEQAVKNMKATPEDAVFQSILDDIEKK